MRAVVANEVTDLLDDIGHGSMRLADVSAAVAVAVHTAAVRLARHAALQRLLAHEPGEVMPYISFDGAAPLLATAGAWGRVHLARFLSDRRDAEPSWPSGRRASCSRTSRSPTTSPPSPTPSASVRLVDTYLVPGLRVGVPA